MTNVCQTHYQWRSRRMPLLLCWQASPLHLMRIQLEWNWLSPICDWSRVCIHSAQSLLGVAGHLSFQTLSLSISIMTHQLCLMLKYQLTATTSLCNKCCIFSFWWNPRVHAEAHTCTDSDARPCMLPEGSVRTSNESRVVSPVVVWQLLSLVHERLTGKFYYTFFKSKGPVCVNVFSPDTLACTHTHTQSHTHAQFQPGKETPWLWRQRSLNHQSPDKSSCLYAGVSMCALFWHRVLFVQILS